ncbi:MAG TPA: hypothetical protein VF172_11945 [Nitrososphaera sp.]|jgi:hypothetical protein
MAERERVTPYRCLACNAGFAELKTFREHMKASGHSSWTVSSSELFRLGTLSPRKILSG